MSRAVRCRRGVRWMIPVLIVASGVFTAKTVGAANGSVSYTYDALGRITIASYDSGVCVTYTYDANGNRLSQTVNVGSGALTWGAGAWGGCMKWS